MQKEPLDSQPQPLDLGVIGNLAISALIDRQGRIVWCCLPRVDGDPVFNSLLTPKRDGGHFTIVLENQVASEQAYEPNTAILRTVLRDGDGGAIEIVDFAPRFLTRGRSFRPLMLVRRVRPLSGSPRIAVQLRPLFDWGTQAPVLTHGSNHVRYVDNDKTLRLTCDVPIDYVLKETAFLLERPVNLVLGPDETLDRGVGEIAREFEEKTADYWRTWTRRLALPLEWQDAVIRAAITLKLCVVEDTGAIVAALTTSISEAADSGRNWDYRYCWLRDAFFVVRALNSLAEVATMEEYLVYLTDIVQDAKGDILQPVFGVGREKALTEELVEGLAGYRGMGPVRRGNQAHEHHQHDVYGNVVLAASQAFFDRRLLRPPGLSDFERLETMGEQAFRVHDQPDAGLWELRTRARVHTSSTLLCWAACDRLAKVAEQLGLAERADFWKTRATTIRATILERCWSETRQAFVESFDGEDLDASVLLMAEVGFLPADDPRFRATLRAVEAELGIGHHMRRYKAPDDFGAPETAFNVCTFWRIDALARCGRQEEAREIFEAMLAARNHLGLLSEDVDPKTGELWGNFPQTYSMVGIINGAVRLSKSWETKI
ncbi:MAG: glycoside hydrolase family 15 protein [Rhodospirillales bacterium]